MSRLSLGNGIGIECTTTVLRGARLDSTADGGVAAAAEVAVRSWDDDRSLLDSLLRMKAELDAPPVPTRLAIFLATATLQRFDVTGASGPELNGRRAALEETHGIRSTVLVDDGPRRWLIGVRWDERQVARLEEIAERAGFVDNAIDPSPVALARVLSPGITSARRAAATNEAFEMIVDGTVPVVAGSIDPVGRVTPGLDAARGAAPASWFDGLVEPTDLMAEMRRLLSSSDAAWSEHAAALRIGPNPYPEFPDHDMRAPARLCVALGAAVGAAGLAGRLSPVDVHVSGPSAEDLRRYDDRPWVVERLSDLPPREDPRRPSPMNRFLARAMPRRRRG
jgi:hypothetical protein